MGGYGILGLKFKCSCLVLTVGLRFRVWGSGNYQRFKVEKGRKVKARKKLQKEERKRERIEERKKEVKVGHMEEKRESEKKSWLRVLSLRLIRRFRVYAFMG